MKLYATESDLILFGLAEKPKKKDIDESLDELFELSPESAIVRAFNLVESKFLQLVPELANANNKPFRPLWQSPFFPRLLDDLVIKGFLTKETAFNFALLREARNRSAHHTGRSDLLSTKESLTKTLEISKEFIAGLDKAIDSGYTMNGTEAEEANQ